MTEVTIKPYPAPERAFHVVIRNRGEVDEQFVASDRSTLSGFPAASREDAHAMAASLNRIVAFHAERHRAESVAEVERQRDALREALEGFNLKEGAIIGGTADSITMRVPITAIQAAASALARAALSKAEG